MSTTKETTAQAFFYIDGIPTKGLWVDLEDVTGWEDVEEKLLDLFPSSQVDEILCADVEGLARHFYTSNSDSFAMDEWVSFQEERASTHLDDEVIDAYFENCGVSSLSDVEEAYQGEYSSWTDFAEEIADSCFDIPKEIAYYFDYEKFGNDLSFDYFESNGYYFRNL